MGILIAKSMQNPKKYADGLPTAISLYIQLIISCAILGICGNFQFDGYKISHRLTKMSQSRFCSPRARQEKAVWVWLGRLALLTLGV
jgi:hypothetical protein